ncbi:MAG: L-2-hydroxyglutarate oxidase [Flavobacteriaceae bacterium]
MKKKENIAIVGAGIVGLAIAYKLCRQGKNVTIFEKESQLGLHQSGRNSGVLHCGLYYQPGSLKAQLSVDGIREMIDFCAAHEIDHDVCGKAVIATNPKEEKALDLLATRGAKNGLKGLTYLSTSELKRREPFVRASKSLLVPEEGIVDYKAVMQKLLEIILQHNGEIHFNCRSIHIKKETNEKIIVNYIKGEKEFDHLISATGLWSDKNFTRLTQKKSPLKIVPFRGEYLKFKKGYEDRVNHLVYPVPDAQFPFLGVHFTRMIDGSREVGPNAVLALKREGYHRFSFALADVLDSVAYAGLLRFVAKNFLFSWNEFKTSLFLKDFIKKAQKMIPDVNEQMLERGPAGVRAQAISPEGILQMDFNIIRKGRQIHVLNAPSPGATASLAIASHIIDHHIPN